VYEYKKLPILPILSLHFVVFVDDIKSKGLYVESTETEKESV
jgi:hypothetical protein